MREPGKRSDQLVTVFGGSGFLGRHLVRALAKRGYRVRAAVRRPDLAGHLQPLGVVGQINAVQANLRHRESVVRAVAGSHAVVNLVGVLHESGRQGFDAVHDFGARAIAEACRDAGIANLVQVSAIGADSASPSSYARSKAAGEKAARAAVPDAVIMRPAVVFGPEDNFFNRFAGLARLSPFLPLIGGGETKFQPVFVGDVAEAIARAVDGSIAAGKTYELGGPQVRSFADILRYILKVTGRRRLLLPIPFAGARVLAGFTQLLPEPMLTVDQVLLLEDDKIVSAQAQAQGRTLEGMGIEATAMEAIVPTYLWRFRKSGQFETTEIA